ncbi:MAG: WbqC family protein [Akkermansiaceae bacterium]
MKKIAVMQPYLFPYIGYFQLVNEVDTFVCFDDVHFIKKGWINRNNVLLNGAPKLFTFSLSKISQNKLINEHDFADFDNTKKDFMKLIEQSYEKSPQYGDIIKLLERILNVNVVKISNFIAHSLKEICIYLDIQTKIINSSDLEKNNALPAQERIIEIIEKCGGNHYINAIGGKTLYDGEAFSKKDIRLSFIQTKPIKYTQFGDVFTPNLSIIDLLMFNTKDDMNYLLQQYELIKK